MDETTLTGDRWAEECDFAGWYTRVVVMARELTARADIEWDENLSDFKRLLRAGCLAGDEVLKALYRDDPVSWSMMRPSLRRRRALKAAAKAMAHHLLEETRRR
jgi:hypothetical protein